jgi:aryl-alcohol dehydrogenase-like predicted oxidoreductase
VRARLEASLRRLGTDHVDHFQMHRPDPDTPAEVTLGCLAELRAEGKIREIGCTHFTAAQLRGANAAAGEHGLAPYPSIQNHYSLLTRDPENDGVFEACEELGVAFVPYFPLESGLLTGKYRSGEPLPDDSRLVRWGDRASSFIDEEKLAIVERLTAWAGDHGRSLLDLAISWHTSHPLIASVIAGATKPEQVEANVAAASWALSAGDRAEVDAIVGAARTT